MKKDVVRAKGRAKSPGPGVRPANSGAKQIFEESDDRFALWHESNHARLLRGELRWSDLSDQEVLKGMGFNPGGNFLGVRAKYGPTPPRLVQQAMVEMLARAKVKAVRHAFETMDVPAEIALDPDSKDADRLRAVAMLQDRGFGAVPQTVTLTADGESWDNVVSAVAGMTPEEDGFDPDVARIGAATTMGEDVVDVEWWDAEDE